MAAYDLGVDLGTAYTCAVVARGGRTDVVQLGGTSNLIPSVVSIREDGTVLTGEAADRRAITDPSRTVREFKRRFGDDAPYVIGGVPYGAEALVGYLLASVVAAATKVEGEAPTRIALTHPADYGPFKLDLLVHAAHLAGVTEPMLVAEPVAAALAYADREGSVKAGDHLLVYDLGGGTFDAAVVRMDAEGPVVVGTPEGLARLGGIDFDQAVLAHVESATGGAVTALDSTDPDSRAALARLRADCRAAKEALSDDTETEIPVLLPQLRTSVRLTREELEAMVAPRLTDTARVLERVVASAGLGMADIATVLLVGGSSRMPVVSQLVREHTGRPVAVDANPKTTIAAGAAVLAARGMLHVAEASDETAVVAPVAAAAAAGAVAATTVAAAPSADVPPEPPAAPIAIPSADEPSGSKRGVLFAVLGVLALIAIAAGVMAMSGGDDDKTAAEPTTTTAAPTDGGATDGTTTTVAPSDVPEGWLAGDVRTRTDEAISAFDTGSTELDYDTAANYSDGSGVTAGRAYFSTTYCDAKQVIDLYTASVPDNAFVPMAAEIARLCDEGSDDTSGLPESDYTYAWITAAQDDPAFRAAQDQVVDDTYFQPAMEAADALGLQSPLARFLIYDTTWMQKGPGNGDVDGLIRRTTEAVGDPATAGEEVWYSKFLELRRDTLENPDADHEFWKEKAFRLDCFEKLLAEEAYDLSGPITCTGYAEAEFTTS